MSALRGTTLALVATGLGACATPSHKDTLAELENVQPQLAEIYLDDSLERAAQSYRRYLAETAEGPRTPEAMRRLADLQLEQEYGVLGRGDMTEKMSVPDKAAPAAVGLGTAASSSVSAAGGADATFIAAAPVGTPGERTGAAASSEALAGLPDAARISPPAGPREAIDTYWRILASYPDYERNDHVLYQLSRAHDEIGQSDEAMQVMDRLVAQYPNSKFVDEVLFRRGEYFFVRKQYLEAEDAYGAIVAMGDSSAYYEFGLYKLGWTLYKQDLYEEALQNYLAMLDYRQALGHDFDAAAEDDDAHRVADTFRVISLSFSNLGGPKVLDEYFSRFGHRPYADKIYGNLGEFYFHKLRYDDAASVYKSFIALNPLHRVSPHFSMRVVEIYTEAGFPKLVVEAKKEFATVYALDAPYWQHFDLAGAPEVVGFLKTNLTDLASHYHALYQDDALDDERPASFAAAQHWYRQFLGSFPKDEQSPQINYQLADLLLENLDFSEAAAEYERTAYLYGPHAQASAAGYAAIYAHRQHLESAAEAQQRVAMQAAVASSLRFAEAFPAHEQAPIVLGAAADDLYTMADFPLAIEAARKLIDRYPQSEQSLRRSAWVVVAHSSIDLSRYEDAEYAYLNVLEMTAADDDGRGAVIDGLAAAIYKQGEAANVAADYRAAADHFLRIKAVAPESSIRTAAEYDAAAALVQLQDWAMASNVLEEFRVDNPGHELQSEATKQLALVYREDGQLERSAAEHERIAQEADDTDLRRDALLTAGELYDEAGAVDEAVRVYRRYVDDYPAPLDVAMETRWRLADIFKQGSDNAQYHAQLQEIVVADLAAGAQRTDRSRYLASQAALVLAQREFERFAKVRLTQPFEQSLAEKQARMDDALQAFEALVGYEVAKVTAAATFYMAEIFLDFSTALLESQRPEGLAKSELADYESAIEAEAFPFEERAIEVHEENFELLTAGIFNPWVEQSLGRLAQLMPGRYAREELSGGFMGAGELYAYRMPVAPPPGAEGDSAIVVSRAPPQPAAPPSNPTQVGADEEEAAATGDDAPPPVPALPQTVTTSGLLPHSSDGQIKE